MKLNITDLSPISGISDEKAGVQAFVCDMNNYYEDAKKAKVFHKELLTMPVSGSDVPATNPEISEWHFSEVDIIKAGTGMYERNKLDGHVMPVGKVIGAVDLAVGNDVWTTSGGDELLAAKYLVKPSGVDGITTIAQTTGQVPSCCSSNGKYLLFGGADGKFSINSGTSWASIVGGHNFLFVDMNTDGSIWWAATSTTLYYSTNYGSSWTSKASIVVTSMRINSSTTLWACTSTSLIEYTVSGDSTIFTSSDIKVKNGDFDIFVDNAGYYRSTASGNPVKAYTNNIQAVSDEPVGSSVWAYKVNGVWYKNTGGTVTIPSSAVSVTYVSITYDAIGYITSWVYGIPVGGMLKEGMFHEDVYGNIINSGAQALIVGNWSAFYDGTSGCSVKVYTFSSKTSTEVFSAAGTYYNYVFCSVFSNVSTNIFGIVHALSGSQTRLYRVTGTTLYEWTQTGTLNGVSASPSGRLYCCVYTSSRYRIRELVNGSTTVNELLATAAEISAIYCDGVFVWWAGYRLSVSGGGLIATEMSNIPLLTTSTGTFSAGKTSFINKTYGTIINGISFFSDNTGFYKAGSDLIKLSSIITNANFACSSSSILFATADGLYKYDLVTDGVSFIGYTAAQAIPGGRSPFIACTSGYTYLLGITKTHGDLFYHVSIAKVTGGYGITTLARSQTVDLAAGEYILMDSVDADPLPIIDPDTAKQMLMFKDALGMVWKKKAKEYVVKFFGTEIYPGIYSDVTYHPDHITQYGARFAMAGGRQLTGLDAILNGTFTSSLASWIVSNATWGSGYGFSGGGAKIENGYIRQSLSEECFVVALVKGDVSGVVAAGYKIDLYSGAWFRVIIGYTKSIDIASTGTLYVDSVCAYKLESINTSVFISDLAQYEEFFEGSGSIQKVPSMDNEITGLIQLEKSLYVIKDDSTGRIDETGDINNPYYVTEEIMAEGGLYPVKFGNTFMVVRKRANSDGSGESGAELFAFGGSGYDRINSVWSAQEGIDTPFLCQPVSVASIGDLSLLMNDASSASIIRQKDKVGKASFNSIGKIHGDITDGCYCAVTDDHYVRVYSQAGDPDKRKRLKGVSVFPANVVTITPDGGIATASTQGAAGFNMTGEEFNIRIDATGVISQITLDVDLIMPRITK